MRPAPAPIAGITTLPPSAPGMRIGIFGGSFNPLHEGHLLVAEQCLKRLALDALWLLVSPGNPLKQNNQLPPLEARVRAARAAISDRRINVTGYESAIGARYTVDTVSALRRRLPGRKLVWIMGGDSFRDFHRWERWQELASLVPMAIYARPDAAPFPMRSLAAVALARYRIHDTAANRLADLDPPAWVYLTGVVSAQSSTAIRAKRP